MPTGIWGHGTASGLCPALSTRDQTQIGDTGWDLINARSFSRHSLWTKIIASPHDPSGRSRFRLSINGLWRGLTVAKITAAWAHTRTPHLPHHTLPHLLFFFFMRLTSYVERPTLLCVTLSLLWHSVVDMDGLISLVANSSSVAAACVAAADK